MYNGDHVLATLASAMLYLLDILGTDDEHQTISSVTIAC